MERIITKYKEPGGMGWGWVQIIYRVILYHFTELGASL